MRLHLVPALGHHKLQRLQPLHIQAYYSQALQTGRLPRKRKSAAAIPEATATPRSLSAQTVIHHHRVLREAFHQAVKWQLLVRNPLDAVEPPRPERREMCTLDQEGMARLLAATEGHPLYMPVLLAVTTGMRRGEILALRWQDVDMAAGKLSVRQAVQKTRDGVSYKQPKTQKSRRVITLPSLLVEALRHHWTAQGEALLRLGRRVGSEDLVCARADGSPMDPSAVSKAFAVLAKRAGLAGLRFHDLRHTHAT